MQPPTPPVAPPVIASPEIRSPKLPVCEITRLAPAASIVSAGGAGAEQRETRLIGHELALVKRDAAAGEVREVDDVEVACDSNRVAKTPWTGVVAVRDMSGGRMPAGTSDAMPTWRPVVRSSSARARWSGSNADASKRAASAFGAQARPRRGMRRAGVGTRRMRKAAMASPSRASKRMKNDAALRAADSLAGS